MQENKKRKIVILSICAITLMLAGILSTYAYFMVSVNNDRRQEAEIDTGTMILRFADGDEGVNATLLPNESIIKKFTLENTGTLDATVSIEWLDMINTYIEESLTYTLEYSENQDGEYTEIVSKTNVPTSSTEFTSTLVPDITIPVGKTYYYNLVITFNDLEGIDQTPDYDAKFVTKFVVNQSSTNRKYTLTIDPNGGIIDDSTDLNYDDLNVGDNKNISIPTRNNYIFDKWVISGYGSSVRNNVVTMGKANTKLVAQWREPDKNALINKANSSTIKNYDEGSTGEMYVFDHEATEQTTALKDYRYIGPNPNNYIEFNNETWRIIGVFPTMNPKTEKYEKLIKIVREESIGSLPWHIENDYKYTHNNWPDSSLYDMLNNDYINNDEFTVTIDAVHDHFGITRTLTIKGLNSVAKNQIENATWYLGGLGTYYGIDTDYYYAHERGKETCLTTGSCPDKNTATSTTANVGLIYPSDYGYTYGKNVNTACFDDLYTCNENNPEKSWMHKMFNTTDLQKEGGSNWTITPFTTKIYNSYYDKNYFYAFRVDYRGRLDTFSGCSFWDIGRSFDAHPAVYLKQDVKIVDGDGTIDNKYKIEFE